MLIFIYYFLNLKKPINEDFYSKNMFDDTSENFDYSSDEGE